MPKSLLEFAGYDGDESDFGMLNEDLSLEYCIDECEKLADQLAEIGKKCNSFIGTLETIYDW